MIIAILMILFMAIHTQLAKCASETSEAFLTNVGI